MSFLKNLSIVAIVLAPMIVMAGGMSVRRDPNGTWIQVNVVHVVGIGVLFLGVGLALVVMSLGIRARSKQDAELK